MVLKLCYSTFVLSLACDQVERKLESMFFQRGVGILYMHGYNDCATHYIKYIRYWCYHLKISGVSVPFSYKTLAPDDFCSKLRSEVYFNLVNRYNFNIRLSTDV